MIPGWEILVLSTQQQPGAVFFQTAVSPLVVCEITLVGLISMFKKMKQIEVENTMCTAYGIDEYCFMKLSVWCIYFLHCDSVLNCDIK